ncbi:uncharacterized protein DS421_20g700400 [Arachis hypogaea]|nr:uncharacterized protein DS421_20g700400 [Arachis hypogaea]
MHISRVLISSGPMFFVQVQRSTCLTYSSLSNEATQLSTKHVQTPPRGAQSHTGAVGGG